MSLIYGVPTIIGWLHHTIYHHHHIHHHHHLNDDDDHQAEWTGISSSLLWSSSTKVGTAGTFLSGEIGGLLTRSIWWRSEMIKRKIMIIWKKHYWWCSWKWNLTRGWKAVSWDDMMVKWKKHIFHPQVLTSPRYEHTVASIPVSKVKISDYHRNLISFVKMQQNRFSDDDLLGRR